MRVDRPGPGEELNTGETTPARVAASVIVARDGEDGLEILLVQRNPAARFMGGAWVFPGGAVHDEDDGPAGAGRRELEEEAGIRLGRDDELLEFSRWITPAEVKIRFDTWFYVAAAPGDTRPEVDGSECVDWRWIAPATALEEYAEDELTLVFPTIKHLEQLARFRSVEELLAEARSREGRIEAVQPRIVTGDGEPRVLLPGEPGFDD